MDDYKTEGVKIDATPEDRFPKGLAPCRFKFMKPMLLRYDNDYSLCLAYSVGGFLGVLTREV